MIRRQTALICLKTYLELLDCSDLVKISLYSWFIRMTVHWSAWDVFILLFVEFESSDQHGNWMETCRYIDSMFLVSDPFIRCVRDVCNRSEMWPWMSAFRRDDWNGLNSILHSNTADNYHQATKTWRMRFGPLLSMYSLVVCRWLCFSASSHRSPISSVSHGDVPHLFLRFVFFLCLRDPFSFFLLVSRTYSNIRRSE